MSWIWLPFWGPVWVKRIPRPKGQKHNDGGAKKIAIDIGTDDTRGDKNLARKLKKGISTSKYLITQGESSRKLMKNKNTKAYKPMVTPSQSKNKTKNEENTVDCNEHKFKHEHKKPDSSLAASLYQQFQPVGPGFFQFKVSETVSQTGQVPASHNDLAPPPAKENQIVHGCGHSFQEKYQEIGVTTDGTPIFNFI